MNDMNEIPQDFYFPRNLGQINQSKTFDSPLMIFKIENTSFGFDTQQGIIELLPYLHRQFGVQVICLEGASGSFRDFSKLRKNLPPEQMERLKTQLKKEMEEGTITGPEYVTMTSDLPLTLYGVENAEQYKQHGQALAQTHYGNKITLRNYTLSIRPCRSMKLETQH
jgi:hypothetical protein